MWFFDSIKKIFNTITNCCKTTDGTDDVLTSIDENTEYTYENIPKVNQNMPVKNRVPTPYPK